MKIDKPTFPPGWKLPDGTKILKRIDKQQFVEVFSLDTSEYLYIFHDESVLNRLKQRDLAHTTLQIDGVTVASKRYPDHKEGDISERLKSILYRRGLEAIAGMAELKQTLIRDVIQPFLNWETYAKYGVIPSNGILFFGPPGCGKTFIARKLAEAIRAELIELSEGSIGSSYIHATSKNILQAFQKAEKIAPCVLFVDEISGLMPRRDNIPSYEQYREGEINEFLMQMEGSVQKKVLVIGATNFPERVDPAILRSGRMDKKIFIPPPDKEARKELFQLLLEERPTSEGIDFDTLAQITEGLISSDLKLIVNNTALKAVQKNELISMSSLIQEASQCQRTITQADLDRYLTFETHQRIQPQTIGKIGF